MDDNNHTAQDNSNTTCDRVTICVRRFDRNLWNVFLAHAKMKGLTGAQYMEQLINKELNNANNSVKQGDLSIRATEP